MNDIILLKIGEIILKGLNRRRFEQKLLGNIRWRLGRIGKFRVYMLQSTIYVEGEDGADMDAAFEELQKVFGVVAISRAAACEKDKDAIAKLAVECMRGEMSCVKSFKVESKRSDKSFPMTSVQLSQYVGGELSEAYPEVAVDVHDPELTVHIEVRDLAAYVHKSPAFIVCPNFSAVLGVTSPRSMRSAPSMSLSMISGLTGQVPWQGYISFMLSLNERRRLRLSM